MTGARIALQLPPVLVVFQMSSIIQMDVMEFCFQLYRSNILGLLFARLWFWTFLFHWVVLGAMHIVLLCTDTGNGLGGLFCSIIHWNLWNNIQVLPKGWIITVCTVVQNCCKGDERWLVRNMETLDDLERRNSPNERVISPNLVAFGADYVKVAEDTPILSTAAM